MDVQKMSSLQSFRMFARSAAWVPSMLASLLAWNWVGSQTGLGHHDHDGARMTTG